MTSETLTLKGTQMTTTTSLGFWHGYTGDYFNTLHDAVADALAVTGESLAATGEYDYGLVDRVADAYRVAINDALPDSVQLCGDEFFGPAYEADRGDFAGYPLDADGGLDIAEIIAGVDLAAIVDGLS